MAKQIINIGSAVNDKSGDPLRTAFQKVNANFTELYAKDVSTQYHLGDDVQFVDIDPATGTVVIQSGYDTGMPVYIKGANCADGGTGGNVVIEAGGPPLGELITGTVGNVEIAANQTTIDSNGKIWTFDDSGRLALPESNGYIFIPVSNAIIGNGVFDEANLTDLAVSAENSVRIMSNNIGSTWTFGKDGRLTVPSPTAGVFTLTFAESNYVPTEAKPTLTLTDDPWELHGEYGYDTDGQAGLLLDNIWPILVNPGYETGDQFTFDEAVHGIIGFVLTITLDDVVLPGGAGWTANVIASAPPIYPSTINSQGAIKITSNENSLILGTDGNLTLPGGLTFSTGAQIFEQADGIGPAWATGLNIRGSSTNDPIRIYAYGGDSKGYNAAGITVNQHSVVIYGDSREPSSPGAAWTFGSDATLSLPNCGAVGAAVIQPNDTTFGIKLISNSHPWAFGTDGNLTLPAGGVIKNSDGSAYGGSSGISISDFGEGFSLTAANKVVTNKLYSTNLTQPTQHYRLELDTNGVIHLPDQSIINGATLKSVAGNYAGITAGPIGKDEDSWVWVDSDGAWIATDYSDNAYQWHFGNDGTLTFPDTNLTIENSTIGRKAVTIFDDGLTHTEDVEGSRLAFTDTSTSLETYSDPDGPNNTMMARHYTNGGAIAGLEVYAEDLAGRTGTSLYVTGGGVVIESGDGILSNTWNFEISGDSRIPGKIKRHAGAGELDLGVIGTDNVLLKTTDDFDDTQLFLSALAGASLTSNHNILVSAAAGSTELSTIYAESEYMWELVRDEDLSMISPATRPWAGMPSFEAYPLILGYTPPGGVTTPPVNMPQVAKTASDNYTAWQEELAATCVAVSVDSKQWTFKADGKLQLPVGGDIVDSEGETVLGFASTSYSLSDVLSTVLEGPTTSGVIVTGNATGTFSAGTEIQFKSLAGAEFTVSSSTYNAGDDTTTVIITDYTGFGPVDGDKIYIEYHGVQEIYAGTGIALGVTEGNSGRVLTIAAEPATVIGITSSATTTYHVSTSFTPPNGDWNWSNWDGMREIGGFTPNATFYSVLKGIQPGDNITVNETDSYVIDYITTGGGATGYFHIFITSDSLARYASISSLTFDIVNVTLTGNTTVDNDLKLTGKLTFPDSTVQTTAYREVAAPTTSKGANGDREGQIAFDNNYIYRCTANYTFGETDIWSRVALDSTPWPVMYTLTITTAGAGDGIITSTPAGIDSGTFTATFVSGTVVNLSASAAMGSVFVGWAGPEGVSGTAPVVITMTSDISVTATFDLI